MLGFLAFCCQVSMYGSENSLKHCHFHFFPETILIFYFFRQMRGKKQGLVRGRYLIFVRKHQARTKRTKRRASTSKMIATCGTKDEASQNYWQDCRIVISPSLRSFHPPPPAPVLCSVFSKCRKTGTANGSGEHHSVRFLYEFWTSLGWKLLR